MKRSFTILITVFFIISFHSFAFAGNSEIAKSISVRSIIKDRGGNTLPGATITEKGTKNAVIAGENGAFIIVVNEGAVLSVTYVGFEQKDVPATAGADIIIKAPEPNVAENLVGKVAGLNILTKTNLFENPEIYLRGQTILVVIDGVSIIRMQLKTNIAGLQYEISPMFYN